ncbi:histamine receptor H2b [Electrophorus electricus]|uniref:Histamine receptor H2b n=1 Tax=Electrophorus electricus TaxID=8005 RepID=A0A4W4DSM0_ELEEL|nr:histamine receptor H2b [Electrophorus electricus]
MAWAALRWVVLMAFIALTIGGNALVCLAVASSRRLRRLSSCFVVSLAVTDLLLALLVLPLAATLELRDGRWPLGGTLCSVYLSVDVTLCAASIFTLLAISVDRYLAISAPLNYTERVTPRRVLAALGAIWTLSLTLAFAPVHLGWNTANFSVPNMDREVGEEAGEGRTCRYEWNNDYVVLVAFGTYFLPLLVMCGMYHRIFCTAREQVRRIRAATPSFARSASAVATAREHKATVTLAAVLGAFLVCWLPYFIYFTCMGLRRETHPPLLAHSVVLWLGYFNSAVNPILYPALNRDFRQAYRQLLRCRVARKRLPASPRVLVRERGAVSHGCQRKHSRSEPSAINPRETMDESSPEHTSPCLAGKSEMQA